MTGGPLVTVVVPCFNYGHFLEECVGSVVDQTYPRWEVFVVDDQSTEGDVAAEMAKFPDERVHLLLHDQTKGVAATRNTGVRGGTGELVYPLDADDKLSPLCLETLVTWLAGHPDHHAVFSDFELFDGATGHRQLELRTTRDLLYDQWIPGSGTLFRRDLYESTGGFFEDYRASGNEDWEFWLNAASQNGFAVGHVPEPLYHYRVRHGSFSERSRLTEHQTREMLYERHSAFFDAHGAGKAFLAEGYRRSTLAELSRRRFGRAARHAARGLWLAPVVYLRGMLRPVSRRVSRLIGGGRRA